MRAKDLLGVMNEGLDAELKSIYKALIKLGATQAAENMAKAVGTHLLKGKYIDSFDISYWDNIVKEMWK